METTVRAAARGPFRFVRRLSRWQMAFLLPCLAMVVALLLHIAQWVTSWISTALAQALGGADACPDLVTDFGVDSDAIEIIDRAPFGFVCQASTYDGGTAMIEHSGATSAMFITSVGLAALGSAVLLGVLLAFTVTRLLATAPSPRDDVGVDRWALLLIGIGVFVVPLMMIGQYLQWYSASKSGGDRGSARSPSAATMCWDSPSPPTTSRRA